MESNAGRRLRTHIQKTNFLFKIFVLVFIVLEAFNLTQGVYAMHALNLNVIPKSVGISQSGY